MNGETSEIHVGNNENQLFPDIQTYCAYLERCSRKAAEIDPDMIMGVREKLFFSHRQKALEQLFQQKISKGYLDIDYQTGELGLADFQSLMDQLDSAIEGVSTKALLIEVGRLAWQEMLTYAAGKEMENPTKETLASGRCGIMTQAIVEGIKKDYPSVNIQHVRMPMPDPTYGTVSGQGHSIAGIKFANSRNEKMILLLDATIAASSENLNKDVEVTLVPEVDYRNYLRLRYAINPDLNIRDADGIYPPIDDIDELVTFL